MKISLLRPSFCFFLALFLISWAGSAAYGIDAISFNPVPVSVQASAAAGGVPVGTIVAWPVATNPSDADSWLECNGQSTAGYPELAAVVGSAVPNYQGLFLRGHGTQSSAHYGSISHNSENLGAVQGDAIRNITGLLIPKANSGATVGFNRPDSSGAFALGARTTAYLAGHADSVSAGYELKFSASGSVPTANENRPINMAVRYLIRARP